MCCIWHQSLELSEVKSSSDSLAILNDKYINKLMIIKALLRVSYAPSRFCQFAEYWGNVR